MPLSIILMVAYREKSRFPYGPIRSCIQHVLTINDFGIYLEVKFNFNLTYHIDKIRNKAISKLCFLKISCSEFSNAHIML